MISVFDRVEENIMGRGENAGYQHFLLFPTMFSNCFFIMVVKNQDCESKSSLHVVRVLLVYIPFFIEVFTYVERSNTMYLLLTFPKQALVFICLQHKSFENTVGKGEIARN